MPALKVQALVALGDAPDGSPHRRPYAQVDVGDVRVTLYESLLEDGKVIIDIDPADGPIDVTVSDDSVWYKPTTTKEI